MVMTCLCVGSMTSMLFRITSWWYHYTVVHYTLFSRFTRNSPVFLTSLPVFADFRAGALDTLHHYTVRCGSGYASSSVIRPARPQNSAAAHRIRTTSPLLQSFFTHSPSYAPPPPSTPSIPPRSTQHTCLSRLPTSSPSYRPSAYCPSTW